MTIEITYTLMLLENNLKALIIDNELNISNKRKYQPNNLPSRTINIITFTYQNCLNPIRSFL